jgi:hypothetical protein
VLSRQEALRRGFTRREIERRLASGKWQRILPRTYFTGGDLTDLDRAVAALAFAGDGALLSGAAALRESEVRGIRAPRRILVLVPPANRTRSAGWVDVRRTFRPLIQEQWLGLPRVAVARAAADLALATPRLSDVRALVARVVQDRHCTVDELARELEEGPRRGSAHLRRALVDIGYGAASAPEAEAAAILRRHGITGFVQNAAVRLPDGSVRILDFYWPELRACLEIDSVEWHTDPAGWSGTWDRHLQLTKLGLSVIHRPPSALRDAARFATDVREWLAARRAELGLRCAG